MDVTNYTPPKIEDFDLINKIGVGSYATVYRCMKKDTREILAIKCVEKARLSKTAVDNIITEIRLLKKLKHVHIVTMVDFLWDEGKIYILMEYCNSGNLSNYIKKHCSLPETTCRFFMRQLSLAFQYMRSNNVSHFDLKPQNLLLTKAPQITLKIADFGFAQHLRLDEENRSVKGSPLYMAPEILMEQKYNAKADLWSIGVILYECLFGHAPYSSKNLQELFEKVRSRQRIDIPKSAKISPECHDLLLSLLRHDPKQRIDFQEYFEHEFLDLKHVATDENFNKALSLVTEAVQKDTDGFFEEAYHLYCESLRYFIPYVNSESDVSKKAALKQQIKSYLDRAEQIKATMIGNCLQAEKRNCNNVVESALCPSPLYQQLYAVSSSSPILKSALEIGRKGELYIFERNFTAAYDTFKMALGQLVPLLSNEPKGPRRDMLHKQTKFWMQEAESLKSILSAHHWQTEEEQTKTTTAYNCIIQ